MGPLSRRTFLRGAGVALALPFLEGMLPRRALAQGRGPRTRFLAWYVPNGIHMPAWTPPVTGPAPWEITPILEALRPLRDQVTSPSKGPGPPR